MAREGMLVELRNAIVRARKENQLSANGTCGSRMETEIGKTRGNGYDATSQFRCDTGQPGKQEQQYF